MTLVDAREAGHDLTSGAISTLQGIIVEKRLLQWMQLAIRLDAFDRLNRSPDSLYGQR
jgi:hypothetical protein